MSDLKSKWAGKISDALTKATAIYPGAKLRIEVSEPLFDLLKELFVNQERLVVKTDSPYFEMYGVNLKQVDDVNTFRITASFTLDERYGAL